MSDFTLDSKSEAMLSQLQDTDLDPMEEALFKSWTKANQIEKPDSPDDRVDYRGIYKMTGGTVLPTGQLKRYAEQTNAETKLEQVLRQKMMDRITEITGKKEDQQANQWKADRQDVTHKQKIEMEKLKLQKAPHELKLKEHDVKAKQFDIQKQQVGIESQKIGNEGKKIDMISSLVAPKPAGGTSSAPKDRTTPTK